MASRRRQFGELSKLPSGKFRARFYGPDGLRYSAPHTFLTERDARRFLSIQEGAISAGNWTPPTKQDPHEVTTNFVEYFNQRLKLWQARTVRPIKASTAALYRKLLRLELEDTFGGRALDEITPALVEDWYAKSMAGGKPTQTNNAYGVLRRVMADAVKAGLVPRNPCTVEGAGKPAPKHEGVALTHQDLADYLAAVPEHRRTLLLLLGSTALRVGEALALRRSDVDLKTGLVEVRQAVSRFEGAVHFDDPKTVAGKRRVFLPPAVLEAVKEWVRSQPMRGSDALLFSASDGVSPLNQSVVREAHMKGREAIGRPSMHLHDLRRTVATLAAQEGATVKELMVMLGHTTPTMAMRYQAAEDDRLKALAARWDAAHAQVKVKA